MFTITGRSYFVGIALSVVSSMVLTVPCRGDLISNIGGSSTASADYQGDYTTGVGSRTTTISDLTGGTTTASASPYDNSGAVENWATTTNTALSLGQTWHSTLFAAQAGSNASTSHELDFTALSSLAYQVVTTNTDTTIYTELLDATDPLNRYKLIDSHVTGTFSGSLIAGDNYALITQASTDPFATASVSGTQDLSLTLTTTSTVPEPTSMTLIGIGGICLAIGAYRRRRTVV